jgi:hypothetical protein
MGSTAPILQCTDLARELREIDVVTNDDVPFGVTNEEVVAEHFSLSGTVRFGYAHVRASLSKQSVQPAACKVAATFGRDFRHEQAKPTKPPRPRCRPKRVPDPFDFVTFYKRSNGSLAKVPRSTYSGLE